MLIVFNCLKEAIVFLSNHFWALLFWFGELSCDLYPLLQRYLLVSTPFLPLVSLCLGLELPERFSPWPTTPKSLAFCRECSWRAWRNAMLFLHLYHQIPCPLFHRFCEMGPLRWRLIWAAQNHFILWWMFYGSVATVVSFGCKKNVPSDFRTSGKCRVQKGQFYFTAAACLY